MPGGIKVTPEQLHLLSGNVHRGSAEIAGSLASLSGQISPLVGGDWAGSASVQFSTLWERWQRSAKELNSALQGISQLLGSAGTSYAEAERHIASSFRT
ncbi:MAG: WXG100 family type VII secretion target [Actinomycetota bacterium]|nr:WXG100 family type VII secretion target [Actinomycetota bacterium]